VLILAGSVGPAPSLEEAAVRVLHPTWQIDFVSDTQWAALTAADFASYEAIIIGDGSSCAPNTRESAVLLGLGRRVPGHHDST
jgi:hypothetical protein